MTSKVTLEATEGPLKGARFTFEQRDTFIFGRAPDCHAKLSEDDKTISRHHFMLEVNPPRARLRDLGSMNGTYVDGAKVGGRAKGETAEVAKGRAFPYVDIADGAKIRAGRTVFLLRAEEPLVKIHVPSSEPAATVSESRPGTERKAPATPDPIEALLPRERKTPRHEIGGCDIVRLIGLGPYGGVYLARRKRDARDVVVKVMLPQVESENEAADYFLREVESFQSLRHPNIVELHAFASSQRGYYFVSEYVPGGSAADLLAKSPAHRVDPARAVKIALHALEGLAHAHAEGLAHRGIKPQNILLEERDGTAAKISDIGLAKSFEKAGLSGFTATGELSGGLAFVAREELTQFKSVRPAADVWSMGAVLYALIAGQAPRIVRPGEHPAEAILRGEIVPIAQRVPGLSPALAQAIDRALADDADKRFASASEFRDALRLCVR